MSQVEEGDGAHRLARGAGSERAVASTVASAVSVGNDRLLFGIILRVLAFWLFAQKTLNIAPAMRLTWASRRAS